ncbi:NAD-dependent epimerase/dehydratase family protein [Pseudoalteromonas sp. MMG022]|uniref:NAD-dependent epimerase/dehydratase family protein n=1 Tax=Pseudoalteromonas sp. MMG022 TaxID=2909978 RepID=UPI001F03174C|nr:NAD-dependent epimerase/dehydratase family protein [Pseudoalteromonas sp. MMG022]MCF6433983.1 NAD-dependent epimerase/dehydratase family protein [Pseudoalteromonas sp. MMG022]
MQTILGANGQIGHELALSLKHHYSDELRLVSRNPKKVNHSDQLFAANLLDTKQTQQAIAGSKVVYFTTGLPIDTKMWVEQWPVMMQNVINACVKHHAKLVYFDNTYMYPQNNELQTEHTPFAPYGEKGKVRGLIAHQLLDAIKQNQVEAMICRAPEFYGPGKTQSITNVTILDRLRNGQNAKVFLSDKTLRTLIYTPDASKAMALLGNTSDAYGQTWHLPCDDNRLTYQQMIATAIEILDRPCNYRVIKGWQLKLFALVNSQVKETLELLPRYQVDNLFVSDKFKQRFPEFAVTTYQAGLTQTLLTKDSR